MEETKHCKICDAEVIVTKHIVGKGTFGQYVKSETGTRWGKEWFCNNCWQHILSHYDEHQIAGI